jgi:hypothetical protein
MSEQSLGITNSMIKVKNLNAFDHLPLPDGVRAVTLPPHELYNRMTALGIGGITPTDGRQALLEKLAAHIESITRVCW